MIFHFRLDRYGTGKVQAGLLIKQHPTPEHRACAISLKFHFANVLTRRIVYRLRLDTCVSTYSYNCQRTVVQHHNDHRWLNGLPGYLTLFTTHSYVFQSQSCMEKSLRLEHSYYSFRFRPKVVILLNLYKIPLHQLNVLSK